MRTQQRFFVSEKLQLHKEIELNDPSLCHQIQRVMRAQTGDRLILLDNSGDQYSVVIRSVSSKKIVVWGESKEQITTKPLYDLILYPCLLKPFDKFEWVLQKGTEMGVNTFIPVLSERTQYQGKVNVERCSAIIREAAEQSGRTTLPILYEPASFLKILPTVKGRVAVLDGSGIPFGDFRKTIEKGSAASLFIGPEGGWSAEELDFAKNAGIPIVRLGDTVLRAETASVAAATLLLLG